MYINADVYMTMSTFSDVYMRENVQAHQGQVTFLRVSASVSKSHDSLASYDHLVSCGTDCTVRIWKLIHPKIDRVSIQQKALIKLLQPPRDLAMVGNTLCMAMADNNVVMCRLVFVNVISTEKSLPKSIRHVHCVLSDKMTIEGYPLPSYGTIAPIGYIKIQLKTRDIPTRLRGIGFI